VIAVLSTESTLLNADALRSTYRDGINEPRDGSVYRKIIDRLTIAEPRTICLQNRDIGLEIVMLWC